MVFGEFIISQPLRVLQIVTQMNRAGLESRLMDIYRTIDKGKIQFDFYTCRKEHGQFDDEIVSLGGNVYYNAPLSICSAYIIPRQVSTFLKNHDYQIVHAHINQWCGLVLMGARQANIPVRIAHSRTALEGFSIKNTVKNIIKTPTNKYATHRFAVSKKAGIWLYGRNAVEQNQVQVLPNAIDSKKFLYNEEVRRRTRKELGIGQDFAIIHVGNIRPEKNHRFLLNVFREILEIKPGSKLLLIGRDDMNHQCQSMAEEMGIAKCVIFLGSRSDVSRLLQAGDVFVFPSFYEGFPGAVLEAQAAGLPCIISDTITDEICITPLVEQLSLKRTAKQWADAAVNMSESKRLNTLSYFLDYDITSLTDRMTNFYINEYNKLIHI